MLKIAVIETGTPAPALRQKFGGYFSMFEAAFGEISAPIHLVNYPVYLDGKLPNLEQYAGILITGSPYGVYEDHEFIDPLKNFILEAKEAAIAVVGICFGHQIMAAAYGAPVMKAPNGWGVGIHTYDTNKPHGQDGNLMEGKTSLSCLLSHQDQVLDLVDGLRPLAGSDFCPNGAISYHNGAGLSFQMHPEFTTDFAMALLESRRDRISADIVEHAQQSFSDPSDRNFILQTIVDFFQNSQKTKIEFSGEQRDGEIAHV